MKVAQDGVILTEAQLAALQESQNPKEKPMASSKANTGDRGAQDTFYVGNMKGVGRIYQQTFVDTYSKVAFAKLYDRKTPLTAADLLERPRHSLLRRRRRQAAAGVDRSRSEYCGNPARHEYELYLAVEDIDRSRTKTKSPQTNGICERFHKTVLNEFYRIAFRKKVYRSIESCRSISICGSRIQ